MLRPEDFEPKAFEELIRMELIYQSELLDDGELKLAFERVIAYNSIPGTYKDGKYDN
jgi:hypothetical protein